VLPLVFLESLLIADLVVDTLLADVVVAVFPLLVEEVVNLVILGLLLDVEEILLAFTFLLV
jgi:hypothetical protein